MTNATLGFIFDQTLTRVLLINKTHPDEQKGKANGIGGKLEKAETWSFGLSREVKEETNLTIKVEDWIYLAQLNSDEWLIHIFTAQYHGELTDAQSMTEEQVAWYDVKSLPTNALSNVNWLVPTALSVLQEGKTFSLTINYFD